MDRVVLTAGVLAVAAGGWLAMLRGWRRRVARQAGLPALPAPPAGPAADLLAPLPGVHVGTVGSGDWLDRVAARGLGRRVAGVLRLTPAGLSVDPVVFVPTAALRAVRVDGALAGKVVGPGGLLVVTWEHGGRLLDTGFRAADRSAYPAWVAAVGRLAGAAA